MLKQNERKFALDLAKSALNYYLAQQEPLSISPEEIIQKFSKESDFLQPLGCFVTLKNQKDELRGCIGTIVSDEFLYSNIINNTVAAGLKDPRFRPITLDQVAKLQYEISVMGALQKVQHMDEIKVGVHGLLIRQGRRQGLLLPQVPLEWEWDKKTFLEQTCLKAGLSKNDYLEKETEIYSFTAEVFSEDSIASITHHP